MNNRNALFGSANREEQSNAEQTRSLWEDQNNMKAEQLGNQISRIKELSLEINGEINDQNNMLDGLGNTFQGTGALMKGTLKRLGAMLESGGSKHMCFLIMAVVGIFLFLYLFLIRH